MQEISHPAAPPRQDILRQRGREFLPEFVWFQKYFYFIRNWEGEKHAPDFAAGGAPPGALLNYGKIPRSFFAPTTRLSADMYAPMRREAFFSAASAQTSSKA